MERKIDLTEGLDFDQPRHRVQARSRVIEYLFHLDNEIRHITSILSLSHSSTASIRIATEIGDKVAGLVSLLRKEAGQ